MGKIFCFSGSWVRNEQMIRERGVEREGADRTPVKEMQTSDGRRFKVHKDSALGLDGDLVHLRGEKVTTLAEIPLPGGDIAHYVQREDGGTMVGIWRKDREGRHVSPGRNGYRRTFSF